jgi:hypothetical protein
MKNQITSEDVLKYHYDETDYLQKTFIGKELKTNNALNEELSIIKDDLKELDKIELNPSKQILKNIFNYSKSKNLEPNNHSGY